MKIGFIAMSAIRTANQELLDLGLTLPGFVERSQVIAKLPSLGLLTLAGCTPEDVDLEYVDVIDLADWDHFERSYDAVAISSFSMQIFEVYELADRYRRLGVKVILGGIHVTLLPDEAAAHADAIVLGEGEPVWPEIVEDLKQNRLKPRYDARRRAFNLVDAPMPRFDLLDVDRYNRFTVQTTRGCPYDCEFCAASIRIAPGYKCKPVEKVIEEIREVQRLKPGAFLEFADDNTFASKAHGRALVSALENEGVKWFTETDISVADDEELLCRMKGSGCAQILVGLESPTALSLEGVERKINWKAKRRERYLRAIERIQSHGITVNGCFVLGLDGSDSSEFDAVFEFVELSGLYEVQITVMTGFPGTPLYHRLEREDRLTHPGQWDRCTLFDVNYRPSHLSVDELEKGFRDLAVRIYNE
ncbi:MAG: B12-binding domain-containing radical SAM protein, partial [Verrucomicrobiae bacterium]|nr:B12-binding domain-containing radical SAM protein [Verrucomicrobiae bacterium]